MVDERQENSYQPGEEGAAVDRFNDPEWMQKALAELDDDLNSVSEELKKSYARLAAGAARVEAELKAAFEAGDEMAYEAARIKKNMILERLRELEALQL
jgi:flagellar biosynthesis/type III secretory pathway protein FliH